MDIENDRYMRLPEVLKITGFSRATLYRKVSKGTFPKQIKTSDNIVAWLKTEVAGWCEHCNGSRNLPETIK